MSELKTRYLDALNTIRHVTSWLKENRDSSPDIDHAWDANYLALTSTVEPFLQFIAAHSKYPLAPVSSTLDRLLDSRFDGAAEAEADLGEIMHKGEKVTVKIKVERGEG